MAQNNTNFLIYKFINNQYTMNSHWIAYEYDSIREQKEWLDNYKQRFHSPCTQFQTASPSQSIKLYTINIQKLQNFKIPQGYDTTQKEISIKLSISLCDSETKTLFSRTYHSASHGLVVDHADKNEELGYHHDPFWVGFYGHEGINLKNTTVVIEITYFIFHNHDASLIEHDKSLTLVDRGLTLGFCTLQLGQSDVSQHQVYLGSAQNYYTNSSPLKQVDNLHIDAQVLQMDDSGCVQKLVGIYNLFGPNDQVIGLLNHQLPMDSIELAECQVEVSMDVQINNLEVLTHKELESDLLQQSNDLYPLKSRQSSPSQQTQIKIKSIQIVSHNGWKATNSGEFNNSYKLRYMEGGSSDKPEFSILEIVDQEPMVDKCYPNSILLFQIVYEVEVSKEVFDANNVIYVGWCAVPVKLLYASMGRCHISIEIKSGDGHSFDHQGQFQDLRGKNPGYLEADLQFSDDYLRLMDQKHKAQLQTKAKISAKTNSRQSLKNRIIQKSQKIRNFGGLDDYEKMKEIASTKEQTQAVIKQIITSKIETQVRTQSIVKEFEEIILTSYNHLSIMGQQGEQQQLRLDNQIKRQQIMESIERSERQQQSKHFDRWIYESNNTHPKMQVFYGIENLQDFIHQTKFGHHDIEQAVLDQLIKYCPHGTLSNTLNKLNEYLSGTLQQSISIESIPMMMMIDIELLSFTPELRFMTRSSKNDYTIPSFYTLENPLPTSLVFVVYMFGQPAITTKKVVYMNGSTKETFDNALKQSTPFYLVNLEGHPIRIKLTIPEQILYGKHAIIEIWNGDNHCLYGKFFMPLFTMKEVIQIPSLSKLNSKVNSSSNSSPEKQKQRQYFKVIDMQDIETQKKIKNDEEFNNKLKELRLPVPVCVSCDVIADNLNYLLGTIQACALIKEVVDGLIQPIKPQQDLGKSKIYSTTTTKFFDVPKVMMTSQADTSPKQKKQILSRIDLFQGEKSHRAESQQLIPQAIAQEIDILSDKLKLDPRLTYILAINEEKEQNKLSFLKQIVDEQNFKNVEVMHRIGTQDVISYKLKNNYSKQTVFTINVEEMNSNKVSKILFLKKHGRLVLITDPELWKSTAERLKFIFPLKVDDQLNKFTKKLNDPLTHEITLPQNSDTIILFYYSAILPCLSSKSKLQQSKDFMRIVVKSSQQNDGGLNVTINEQPPIIHDIIFQFVKADYKLSLTISNPLLLWANNFVHLSEQFSSFAIYSPHFPVTLKKFNLQHLVFESEAQLKIEQEIDIYIVVYKDAHQTITTQVYRLVVRGCEYLDAVITQGKISKTFLPIMFDNSKPTNVRSSKPCEVVISDKQQNFNPVKGQNMKVSLDILSYGEDLSITKFVCLQQEKQELIPIKTLLIYLRPQLSNVSFLYDVECQQGRMKEMSFKYKNKLNSPISVQIKSSHYQLKIQTQNLDYRGLETIPIKCQFRPEYLLNKIQVKVFLHDPIINFFDCIMFRITYLL